MKSLFEKFFWTVIFQLPIDFEVLVEKIKELHKPGAAGAPPNTLTPKMVENQYLMIKEALGAYVQRKLTGQRTQKAVKTPETLDDYFSSDDLNDENHHDFVLIVQAACFSLSS